MKNAFTLFHLNLAFSSIATEQRTVVIERCYSPLLDLVEQEQLPIGIELTGWTLRRIQELAPNWVERFKRMLATGQCELIGSGYTQMIGPLASYEANVWNQRIGMADYQEILGVRPSLVLVNEMAYSSGLVGVYAAAGYKGLVMDRDNVLLALDKPDMGDGALPSLATDGNGCALPVLWSDSILFQKVQRYAHGDITLEDYFQHFRKRCKSATKPLAVYCNDAEVFDYRPGRFKTESRMHSEGEWTRIGNLITAIKKEGVKFVSPSEAIAESVAAAPNFQASISSIAYPVPVKKQAKYNLSRWAATGRNDIWLNTLCHRVAKKLVGSNDVNAWRKVCELWASDLRTHLTADRWQEMQKMALDFCNELNVPYEFEKETQVGVNSNIQAWGVKPGEKLQIESFSISNDAGGIYLTVENPKLKLVVNQRRGLCIDKLSLKSLSKNPVIGTLPHGYFDSILFGADFYSGAVVIELPNEHRRVTDLEWVEPEFYETEEDLRVTASMTTPIGKIVKTYVVSKTNESVEVWVDLSDIKRPHGSIRAAGMTLLPDAFDPQLELSVRNGGAVPETFTLDQDCDHTEPSSSLVSSKAGFGATDGCISIMDSQKKIRFSWAPESAAAYPMLVHRKTSPYPLTRCVFSLCELDDTSRPEGGLPVFKLKISGEAR